MWVRQGRTDAWIAHKLDVSVDELARFKRDHDLEADGDGGRARPADPLSVPPPEPRAEEPEEAEEVEEPEEAEEAERGAPRRGRGRRRGGRGGPRVAAEEAEAEAEVEDEDLDLVATPGPGETPDEETDDEAPRKRRRRGRRGGRRHRGRRAAYEATFDHGEEGYGLWLDPAVADNPVYSEHWAGHRAVTVTVDEETITIRRAGAAGQEQAAADDEADGE
jgi:hypothetical protein